jgi:hypothetical protein
MQAYDPVHSAQCRILLSRTLAVNKKELPKESRAGVLVRGKLQYLSAIRKFRGNRVEMSVLQTIRPLRDAGLRLDRLCH